MLFLVIGIWIDFFTARECVGNVIRFHVLEFLCNVCNADISPINFFFLIFFFLIFQLSTVLRIRFRPYAIRAGKSHPFQVVQRVGIYGGFQLLFWNVKRCSSVVQKTFHILLVNDSQPIKRIHEEHLDQGTSLHWLPAVWSSTVLSASAAFQCRAVLSPEVCLVVVRYYYSPGHVRIFFEMVRRSIVWKKYISV